MNDNYRDERGRRREGGGINFWGGIVLVACGIFFLAKDYLPFELNWHIDNMWPLFMLIPVIPLMAVLVRNPRAYGILIPVVILVFLCFYFIALNYIGWRASAVTWPNYVLAPGLGLLAAYFASGGKKGLLIPAAILIFISASFYIAIFFRGSAPGVIVIGIGLFFLFSKRFRK